MSSQDLTIGEMTATARELEKESRLSEAADLYISIINKSPLHTIAYDRLMIVYRKLKEYRKELQLINKAIKTYENNIKGQEQAWTKTNKKAAKISKTLATKLGLPNQKGFAVYEREFNKWEKRKQTVSKKLAK